MYFHKHLGICSFINNKRVFSLISGLSLNSKDESRERKFLSLLSSGIRTFCSAIISEDALLNVVLAMKSHKLRNYFSL